MNFRLTKVGGLRYPIADVLQSTVPLFSICNRLQELVKRGMGDTFDKKINLVVFKTINKSVKIWILEILDIAREPNSTSVFFLNQSYLE